jgi:hypothetical protein
MPVEINELVIKATVLSKPEAAKSASVADNSQKLQQVIDTFLKKLDKKKER